MQCHGWISVAVESSISYCPLDAYEGYRTHHYGKGQTGDDSLYKQTEVHAAPDG